VGSASALRGRFFLIVEDEPLIALDIASEIEAQGGYTLIAGSGSEAIDLLRKVKCAAAILDHRLSDGDAQAVGRVLTKMQIPFVIYSGLDTVRDGWPDAPIVRKPALTEHLLQTVLDLLE